MEFIIPLQSKCKIKHLHHFLIPIPFLFPVYIPNRCLKPCPNLSPYLSLRWIPRPTFNPASQSYHLLFHPRNRDCGGSFHRSKNELVSHILNENKHLQWHVLQKQQESLWGLVPVFQKSQETICPRAPNLPLVSRSSHAHVPVSTLSVHFHITCELQETLELHSPRKVIPCWCLHVYKNLESLALMDCQCKLTEFSQQKGRHVHSQFSEL